MWYLVDDKAAKFKKKMGSEYFQNALYIIVTCINN